MYRHFCLEVDCLEDYLKVCQEKNVHINMMPDWVEKLGCRCMLIRDPNGVEIELIDRKKE